jgi:general secretion pathway protein D
MPERRLETIPFQGLAAAPFLIALVALGLLSVTPSASAQDAPVTEVISGETVSDEIPDAPVKPMQPAKAAPNGAVPGKVSSTAAKSEKTSSANNDVVENEVRKRRNIVASADQVLQQAQTLYTAGDAKAAADKYRWVLQNLPKTSETQPLYLSAINGFCDASEKVAKDAAAAKDWPVVQSTAADALQFDPENRRFQDLLKQAEIKLGTRADLAFFERSSVMTPEFAQAVGKVRQLLEEAEAFRDSGQFDKADTRLLQVLAMDPYNVRALQLQRSVSKNKGQYWSTARDQARKEMLYQVTKAWARPVPRGVLRGSDADAQQQQAESAISRVGRLEEKMGSITIESVNFEDADLADVVGFLRGKARQQSPDLPINFIIKSNVTNEAGEPEAMEPRKITLNVQNLSMDEVLRLVTAQAGMSYKIEEHAIVLLPEGDVEETLYTQEFSVPAGVLTAKETKKQLEGLGVTFPSDKATAYFDARNSKLIAKNTRPNLDLITKVLSSGKEEMPQVALETRFLEVNQSDLDEISFRWNINRRVGNKGYFQSNVTDTPGLRTSTPAGLPSGYVPDELTVGNGAITANAVDALMQGAAAASGPIGTTMQSFFILDAIKFEFLINALSQKTSTDTLSVPKVTVRSGKSAEIRAGRQFIFPDPESYGDPQISGTTSAVAGMQFRPITPATPTSFISGTDENKLGTTMKVTPTVESDKRTVGVKVDELQVRDFDGFINYGGQITSYDPADGAQFLLYENIINTPVFNVRKLEVGRISVSDGQTILLGGLMRDDRQKVDDKIPVLGDMPIVGRLFRSKIDQTIKKNLLVFITVNLVNNRGEPFHQIKEDSQSFANTPNFANVDRLAPGVDDVPLYQPAATDEVPVLQDTKGMLK